MALRAGYYGLKGSVKKTLEALAASASGMKIIKTIGDGLNLTSAGKLNVTAATDSKLGGIKVGSGLSIENGVLSADATGGIEFDTDEFETGWTWIDGKKICGKVFNNITIPNNALTLSLQIGASADISKVLYFNLTEGTASSQRCMDYRLYANIDVVENNLVLKPTDSAKSITGVDVIVFYTKNEEE